MDPVRHGGYLLRILGRVSSPDSHGKEGPLLWSLLPLALDVNCEVVTGATVANGHEDQHAQSEVPQEYYVFFTT